MAINMVQQQLITLSKQHKNDARKNLLFEGRRNNTQICFFSSGCQFSKLGYCLMCNYGKGVETITKSKLKQALDEIFKTKKEPIPFMLFGTNGSIFDEKEMPFDCFEFLLDYIKKFNINTVCFETFYATVGKKHLDAIKQKLKTRVVIELGFESASKKVREMCLLKFIDNSAFKNKVDLIHSYGFFASTNVLLGIPFLTTLESITDTKKSIRFLMDKAMVDDVVVFPLNIKKHTLLERILHKPVFLESALYLIQTLPKKYLNKINFSWYDITKQNRLISEPPIACPKCRTKIINFISNFMKADKAKRMAMQKELPLILNCQCHKNFVKNLSFFDERPLKARIMDYITKIS